MCKWGSRCNPRILNLENDKQVSVQLRAAIQDPLLPGKKKKRIFEQQGWQTRTEEKIRTSLTGI
jgi:hypothetical protein